jgi:hypothetical protein
MPYTKIAPERLRAGHKGDLSYLMGKKVKARIVQVGVTVIVGVQDVPGYRILRITCACWLNSPLHTVELSCVLCCVCCCDKAVCHPLI